jgi:TatD DNase family protein
MTLFDTHTHLETFARRNMLEETLARAREAGVTEMVTIGTGLDDWDLYRDLAASHEGVHYSVGLHPCAVDLDWKPALAKVAGYWETGSDGSVAQPIALGEIGLDRFHLPKEPAAAEALIGEQKAAFSEGLAIAKRLKCPVVIHSRGAFSECVEMIDASGVDWSKVVFHCFVESEVEMKELSRRGGWASFTGILTYKSAEAVRQAARLQGIERLMIETDAPYLTPVPHRGKPNEPAYLRHTAEFAAEIFGVPLAELAEKTTANARRFFGI